MAAEAEGGPAVAIVEGGGLGLGGVQTKSRKQISRGGRWVVR